ncbi:MAG: FkbM family methyltransferase [Ignavibacteria bacterium]|jgi:FkbM family methyltransferase
MIKKVREIIPKKIRKNLQTKIFNCGSLYAQKTFSQEGEDLILRKFFARRNEGFYVDVGAHHPKRFSNTYHFYKLGWRGINIDATPGSMKLFDKFRPRDINLEIPVSDKNETLEYYIFDDPALNTFSKEISDKRIEEGYYKLVNTVRLSTQSLNSIFDSYLPQDTNIDFLTIDVEGFELPILQSMDFMKYRPNVILVEAIESSLDKILNGNLNKLLKSNKYAFFAKTFNTLFFKSMI